MLIKEIKNAKTIAVSGHIRPDGDCVGSCLGIYWYVKERFPDKQIHVYLEPIPESFHMLKGIDKIRHTIPENEEVDLFLALDCGDENRLGFSFPLFARAKHTMCIDHHISNLSFAEQNFIYPEASSTSELVYNLLGIENISQNIAECLYLGMVHDTGIFRYSCTHPSTMRAAANLMEKGINFTKIITETFDEKTYAQNKILGFALMNSNLYLQGRCIAASVDQNAMEVFQVLPRQLDGIVSQLKLTQKTDVAIFSYELEDGQYKVSLRSTEAVDVSKVAATFGGGGHARAAGVTMCGTEKEILNQLLPAIEKQLKNEEHNE